MRFLFMVEPALIILTFFLAFGINLFSTLVGGRGAVMVPLLMFLGFSPQTAIATNRLSALSGMAALFEFHKQGYVKWRLGLFLAVFAGIGSAIGSFFVLQLDSDILEKGIGIIILLSLPMFLLRPNAGLKERKVKLTKLKQTGGAVMMVFLGTLGGFFSTTGVWFSWVYIFYYGMTFIQRAATGKVVGLFMVSFSLVLFIPAGIINWPVAISMLIGGGLGSWVSARNAKKLGNEKIRYLFLIVMLLIAFKILLL